jgi:hypothetical protein
VLKLYWLPTIQSAIDIDHGDSAQALEALQTPAPYETGDPPPFQLDTLYPVYLRAQADHRGPQGGKLTVEFQKIIDHPGMTLNFPLGALAHLGLGRARALAGDVPAAKTAYQSFFALWKDADPTIPILKDAKEEYAKLP